MTHIESFNTSRYELEVEIGERVGRVCLRDSYSGVEFADSDYRYSAFIEFEGRMYRLEGLYGPQVFEKLSERGGKIITFSGRLGADDSGPQLDVRHRVYIPYGEEFLEEQIVLQNCSEGEMVLRGYRFGFRKRVQRPRKYGGPGIDIEDYRLIALPYRLQPDGKKHDYQIEDVYLGRYQCSTFHNPTRVTAEVVDSDRGRSEGWAWTDGENGLLMIKYNPEMIEHSMLETERTDGEAFLNFGGASPSLFNEPFEARRLEPGKPMGFGQTRYHFYEGLWRRGAYMFREWMSSLGHCAPDEYNPPVYWDAGAEIGRHHSDSEALAERYSLDSVNAQIEKAVESGCEALLLGPGWEVREGGSEWDTTRLGDLSEFIASVKTHGLKLGLKDTGRCYGDIFPGLYRRTHDGRTGYYAAYYPNPFFEPCYCGEQYLEEKTARLMKLADAGVDFIVMDEFDWRGPCYNQTHGHPVPTTPSQHARGVVELTRRLREKHKNLLIVTHDSVWPGAVRYQPVYYLHDIGETFDEVWASVFESNPLECLMSGRALSLFYYNLAYEVPLALHLNMAADNDNCLAFWWYASTVRHIGIGGNAAPERRAAYSRALAEYRSLKDIYVRGAFHAPDELTHIHVLPEEGMCILNAYNLTEVPVSRKVEIRLNDLGLMDEIEVEGVRHELAKGKLIIELDIAPFSPVVIKMHKKDQP